MGIGIMPQIFEAVEAKIDVNDSMGENEVNLSKKIVRGTLLT